MQVFIRMSLCKILTSDQSRVFNNHLIHELMKLLGIDHRLTTPYHSRVYIFLSIINLFYLENNVKANGLDERFNQTILNMLTKFIKKKKTTWEDYLDECVYAYNTVIQVYTRFELMFRRKAVIPADLELATMQKQMGNSNPFFGVKVLATQITHSLSWNDSGIVVVEILSTVNG